MDRLVELIDFLMRDSHPNDNTGSKQGRSAKI